jgi:hypothetical protein
MEAMISNLLSRFEQGRLSRRDLVQGLAMLAGSQSMSLVTYPLAAFRCP